MGCCDKLKGQLILDKTKCSTKIGEEKKKCKALATLNFYRGYIQCQYEAKKEICRHSNDVNKCLEKLELKMKQQRDKVRLIEEKFKRTGKVSQFNVVGV